MRWTQNLREQVATTTRQVVAATVTPLVADDVADLFFPLRRGGDLRAKVVSVTPETDDAATVTLKPSRDWAGHIPGQYIRIGVDVNGVRHWRAYSLTSNQADATISITVKAIPDGKVSNHIVRALQPGTLVQLDQAAGDFQAAGVTGPALFITGGSGITPVMGILRNRHDLTDIVVVHSAPTAADVIFAAELRQLAADQRITLIELHTDADGMLDADQLDLLVPDLATRTTWACGPTGMLDLVEKHWANLGIPERLHTERFRPTIIATGDGGTAHFDATHAQVEVPAGTTILDAAEAAGVIMPSGCRMGICFGCVLPMREGAVTDLRTGEVTVAVAGETNAGGIPIQTCISSAAGDCHFDH